MSITGNTNNDRVSIWGQFDPNAPSGGSGSGLTNPLTSDLDMNGNQITNTVNVVTLPISSDLNLENNSLLNIENLAFHNTGTLSVNESGQLLFNSSPISSGSGSSGVENPMTSNLNANSYDLTNVGGILMKDSVNQLESYWLNTENGGLVSSSATDSSDIKIFICINETGGKTYYTDFRGYPITHLGELTFSAGGSITSSNSSFVFDQPVNFGNNLLTTAQSISFGVSNSTSINLNDGVLQINDDPIVTSSNISTYVDTAVSGLGYFKPGATALNMSNYQVSNALFYGIYNQSNPSLQHTISVSGGKIQLDSYDALNSNNCGSYVGFSNSGAVGTITMNNHDLQGLDTLTFNNSKILTTNGSNQLTYDGDIILTQNDPISNANPWIKYSGTSNSTSPLTMTVSINTSTESSYYFSGIIQSLLCCMKFECFVYPGESGVVVDTPNITTVSDIDGNLLEDVTITTNGSSSISLSLSSQQVAPLYDSVTIMYQLVHSVFQSQYV